MQFIDCGIEAMKAGHKTNTRRVQKEGERLVYAHIFGRDLGYKEQPWSGWNIPTILDKHGHIKWQVGRRYAIQPGRGKFGIGSFLCTSLKGGRLQYMDGVDCMAEGIEKDLMTGTSGQLMDDFRALWDSIHKRGERWDDNPLVFVIGMDEYEWEEKKGDLKGVLMDSKPDAEGQIISREALKKGMGDKKNLISLIESEESEFVMDGRVLKRDGKAIEDYEIFSISLVGRAK